MSDPLEVPEDDLIERGGLTFKKYSREPFKTLGFFCDFELSLLFKLTGLHSIGIFFGVLKC